MFQQFRHVKLFAGILAFHIYRNTVNSIVASVKLTTRTTGQIANCTDHSDIRDWIDPECIVLFLKAPFLLKKRYVQGRRKRRAVCGLLLYYIISLILFFGGIQYNMSFIY